MSRFRRLGWAAAFAACWVSLFAAAVTLPTIYSTVTDEDIFWSAADDASPAPAVVRTPTAPPVNAAKLRFRLQIERLPQPEILTALEPVSSAAVSPRSPPR